MPLLLDTCSAQDEWSGVRAKGKIQEHMGRQKTDMKVFGKLRGWFGTFIVSLDGERALATQTSTQDLHTLLTIWQCKVQVAYVKDIEIVFLSLV